MAMAAICSCSNQYSPPLANISPTPSSTKSSNLKLSSNVPFTNSLSSYTFNTIHFDPLTVLGTETLQHEGAEVESGRDINGVLDINGSGLDVKREHWFNGVYLARKSRRRRRRERRSGSGCEVNGEPQKHAIFVDKKKIGQQSYVLTSKEEATFSWYLKERARLEAVRMKLLSDRNGDELVDSSLWAKTAGISEQSLDKILLNGRLSEERIISCYQRFVVSIASSYQGKGLSLKDLTQEGSIGLLRGAIKYNPEKGYKLSTYAYWWIRQAITRAIASKSRIIRLPGSIIVLMPKIWEANNVLSRRLGRLPTYDEIAEAIGIETSVVRLALERNRSPISLDQAINSQGCMSLQNIIPGPEEVTPEAMVKEGLVKEEIRKVLRPLCEREAHVLRLYYGLNGETPWSFEEIGRKFNLSRERIRQINSSALSKLRQTRGISDDLKYFV